MKKIIALYGRRNSGKDTAAALITEALVLRKFYPDFDDKENFKNFGSNTIQQMLTFNESERLLRRNLMDDKSGVVRDNILHQSFSSKIHEVTSVITGLSIDFCLDRGNKDSYIPKGFNKTIRQIMIDVGEGLRKSYGEDIWVVSLLSTVESNPDKILIIPGMRHKNEYNALSQIDNVCFVRISSNFEDLAGDKEAEGILDNHDFDFVLPNVKDNLSILWRSVIDMVYSFDLNY